MKKLLTLALSAILLCNAQASDLFRPVKKVALRAPSVPLVVSDPYFSIWSPYDKLNEGTTKHWTNAKKPLLVAYLLGTPHSSEEILGFCGVFSLDN